MKLVQKTFKTGYNLNHDPIQMLPEIPSKNSTLIPFRDYGATEGWLFNLKWHSYLAMLPNWCPENAKLEQGLYHNANFSINYSFILHKDYADSSINWASEHKHAGRWKRLSTPTSSLQNLGSVRDWSLVKSFRTLAEENRNWTLASRCAMLRRAHDPTLK